MPPRLISARPSLDHPSLLPTRDRGASVVGFDERCTQSSRRGAKAREARKAKKGKESKANKGSDFGKREKLQFFFENF